MASYENIAKGSLFLYLDHKGLKTQVEWKYIFLEETKRRSVGTVGNDLLWTMVYGVKVVKCELDSGTQTFFFTEGCSETNGRYW